MRIICDLDDTLTETTRLLGGVAAHPERLTLVRGADIFLALYGSVTHILTAGNAVWQMQKLNCLDVPRRVGWVTVVPNHTDKCAHIEQIIESEYGQVIIIGDRLDAEIACGKLRGATTIRVRFEGGRHYHSNAQTSNEDADVTVEDFVEINQFLAQTILL
jgi:FMN phosphatase YigB (HAD superfamily)